MQSSTSGSPESFNLSSSVEGLVGGIEGNSGSRASSSSHSNPRAPKKGNLKKSGDRQKVPPAQSAGIPKPRSSGESRSRISWREMMSKNSENLNGAITDGDVGMSSEMSQPQHGMALSPELVSGREGSFQQVGSGGNPSINMSREETYHDHRQLNPSLHMSHEESFHDHRDQVHQTVQNFVTNPGLDHQVVAEAVEAVTGARSEAAQAMLSARTQVLHANAQFESQVAQLRNEIVARDAALSLAIEKEKLLSTKLEESMKEADALRSNIIRLSQNGAGETEQAIVLRVAEIEKTLATMLMRLDQMGHPQGISQAALNAAGSSSPSRLTRLES